MMNNNNPLDGQNNITLKQNLLSRAGGSVENLPEMGAYPMLKRGINSEEDLVILAYAIDPRRKYMSLKYIREYCLYLRKYPIDRQITETIQAFDAAASAETPLLPLVIPTDDYWVVGVGKESIYSGDYVYTIREIFQSPGLEVSQDYLRYYFDPKNQQPPQEFGDSIITIGEIPLMGKDAAINHMLQKAGLIDSIHPDFIQMKRPNQPCFKLNCPDLCQSNFRKSMQLIKRAGLKKYVFIGARLFDQKLLDRDTTAYILLDVLEPVLTAIEAASRAQDAHEFSVRSKNKKRRE